VQDIKKISMDIDSSMRTKIDAKQNDTLSRFIEFNLFKNNIIMNLTGHTVKIYATKADNTIIFNNVTIEDEVGGKVLVELTSQALAVVGDLNCELVIYGSNNSILSSKAFVVNVIKSVRNDTAIESTNEFTSLSEALSSVEKAVEDIGIVGDIHTQIQEDITIGTALDVALKDDISSGNTLKILLETDIATAETKKTELEAVIATADTNTYETKGSVDAVVANLTAHKNDIKSHGYIGTTSRLDADSFGHTGGSANKRFGERITRFKKLIFTNASVGGQSATDAWIKIKTEVSVPSTFESHILNVGFNDVRLNGDKTNISISVAHQIQAIVAFLRLKNIKLCNDPSIVYSGVWDIVSTLPEKVSPSIKYTNVQGAYVEFSFVGNNITIGSFNLETVGAGGTLEVKIDGVSKFTKTMDSEGAVAYVTEPIIIENLSEGAHTCRITNSVSNGNQNIYFDYYGVQSETAPIIFVNGLTKMKTAQYSINSPYDKANDTIINTTNNKIREILSNFDERVIFIDLSNFDPNNYNLLDTDNVHPNNLGHEWIASNILKRFD